MEFIKKVLVLKQVAEGFSLNGKDVTGILRLESENGITIVYLSVLNLSSVNGEYSLILIDGENKLYNFSLGNRPLSFRTTVENFAISKDFSCGVIFISDDLPTVIAFSSTAENMLSGFKKSVTDLCIEQHKERLKANRQIKKETEENIGDTKTEKAEKQSPADMPYDDEAVATVNYYENEDSLIDFAENVKNGYSGNETSEYAELFKETAEQTGKNDAVYKDADGNSPSKDDNRAYYEEVKAELNNLFISFPEETSLRNVVPDSKWVKINYTKDKYYVVGLVYQDGKEKYICYGVPAKFSTEPPKELKGFCSFVPVSVFNLKGDGFWMMFQDAFTGECVKMNK